MRTAQDPQVLLDYTQLLADPASPSYGIKGTGQTLDAKRWEALAPGHFFSPCPQGYVGSRSAVLPTRLIASKMNTSSSQPAQHLRRREGGVGTRRLVLRLEPESPASNASPSPSICFSSPSSFEGHLRLVDGSPESPSPPLPRSVGSGLLIEIVARADSLSSTD